MRTNSLEPISYHEWLRNLKANPFNSGIRGGSLIVATVAVTFLCGILGRRLFPPGLLTRIGSIPILSDYLLAIVITPPGLLGGVVFLYIGGFAFFKLPKSLTLLLSGLILAISLWFAFDLITQGV